MQDVEPSSASSLPSCACTEFDNGKVPAAAVVAVVSLRGETDLALRWDFSRTTSSPSSFVSLRLRRTRSRRSSAVSSEARRSARAEEAEGEVADCMPPLEAIRPEGDLDGEVLGEDEARVVWRLGETCAVVEEEAEPRGVEGVAFIIRRRGRGSVSYSRRGRWIESAREEQSGCPVWRGVA